jgi:hypothetical protein
LTKVHLDERLPHDEVEGSPIVYQCLGHLVSLDRELDYDGQVSIGQLYFRMTLGPEQDVCLRPLHSPAWFDVMS